MGKLYLKLFLALATLLLNTPQLSAQTTKEKQKALAWKIEQSKVFSKIFTGFALFDPVEKKMIYQKDADKYFTPASNTKILTFYTALKLLGDDLPMTHYITTGDSLIIWGTGNPQFLNPKLSQDSSFWAFLQDPNYELFYSDHNFMDQHYGAGWAWDDFNTAYQPEKSPFPIYGNTAQFSWDEKNIFVKPQYFHKFVLPSPARQTNAIISRDIGQNVFLYKPWIQDKSSFEKKIPFQYNPKLLVQLLSDTLKRTVQYLPFDEIPLRERQTFSSPMPDTLYQLLMQDSDNFIAEQLLLMCSDKIYGVHNTEKIIDYAKDVLFESLPDELVWRDGSGLSRYNLFTPRSLVYILNKIYRMVPSERLLKIFPAGGASGTIEKWYGGKDEPYVFAKTGTLSNKHCLSGFLKTDSGRTLIFSFMHNNYIGSPNPVKKEMERILEGIRKDF